MAMGPSDSERTVIRPNPGGMRPAPGGQPIPAARPAAAIPVDPTISETLTEFGVNPLVAAAAPLINFAARLRHIVSQPDAAGLRERIVREIRQFENRAATAGIGRDMIRGARYVLAATIDDMVLNTPWGNQASWARQSLVGAFENEAVGGERFFQLLNSLNNNPGANLDLLELMYVCLALGFEGQMRFAAGGQSELMKIRDSVYRTIRNHRGEREAGLSPNWRGVDAAHRPVSTRIPVWTITAALGVFLLAVFAGITFFLQQGSGAIAADLSRLARNSVTITRLTASAAPEQIEVEPPPPPVVVVPLIDEITAFLQPEIDEGLVEVSEDATQVTIRLKGENMFASASDQLQPRFVEVVNRVAAALNERLGNVIVEGHSDAVPIQTLRFPDNYALSLARAETVEELVAQTLTDPSRLSADGLADTQPIATNDTAAGRAQNRRIELILIKQAGDVPARRDAPADGQPANGQPADGQPANAQ